jgi:hypothetical protein
MSSPTSVQHGSTSGEKEKHVHDLGFGFIHAKLAHFELFVCQGINEQHQETVDFESKARTAEPHASLDETPTPSTEANSSVSILGEGGDDPVVGT